MEITVHEGHGPTGREFQGGRTRLSEHRRDGHAARAGRRHPAIGQVEEEADPVGEGPQHRVLSRCGSRTPQVPEQGRDLGHAPGELPDLHSRFHVLQQQGPGRGVRLQQRDDRRDLRPGAQGLGLLTGDRGLRRELQPHRGAGVAPHAAEHPRGASSSRPHRIQLPALGEFTDPCGQRVAPAEHIGTEPDGESFPHLGGHTGQLVQLVPRR
ncbi:hypothetical protein SF23_07110 [Streptomyces sp. MBRL 10]|nr:hypothetical protein SF23_07110 [Streptomyces sp. MBRL 10]